MSQENVEIVRLGFKLSNALGRTGDSFVDPEDVAPEFWSRLAPDFELHDRPELPDAKVYRGPDEAKEFFRKIQQVFAEARREVHEVIDLGHAVVVVTTVSAVGRGSDVWTDMPETDVFWFRDGLVVRLQGFATREEALEAARRDD